MSIDTSKIIHAPVGGGRYTVTAPIVKEDYGLYLLIEGLELPSTYEVDFSNSEHNGTSVTMIGNADGVLIPSQFIASGKDVFAFLYHVGDNYGRTVFKFRIPNKLRPDRTDEEPTPEEQSTIDQAISALNSAVSATAQDVIDADASAQSASQSAENAHDSAVDAQNYAESASGYASDAQGYATTASQKATEADNSADQAAQIKTDIEGYVSTAQTAAQTATDKAAQASQSATNASNSATTASTKAGEASASATTASNKAGEASASATTASNKATEASGYANTASQKASDASDSASAALGYKTDAESAKTAAETAQGKAEDAQEAAESAAASVSASAAQIATNTADIADLKTDVAQNEADILKAFPTDTASGAIASFSDGADGIPLKSLVVDINPVQDLSQGDPSPENICPISGWTGCEVSATGKNLFDERNLPLAGFNLVTDPSSLDYGYYAGNAQELGIKSTSIFNRDNGGLTRKIPIGGQVTVSADMRRVDSRGWFRFYYTDGTNSGNEYQINSDNEARHVSFTSNAQKSVSAVAFITNGGSNSRLSFKNLRIEKSGAETAYEQFGRTIPISWQTEAGTVYGGKLDVLSGLMRITHGYHLFDGTGDVWTIAEVNGVYRAQTIALTDMKSLTARVIVISNIGKPTNEDAVGTCRNYQKRLWYYPPTGITTVEQFTTWLTEHNLEVVYELAEPIEIQLTPHEVGSLLGVNNIWADTGDCSVEYRADTKLYIEKLTQPEEDDMIADSAITSGQFFMIGNTLYRALTNIASGATITVGTNAQKVSLSDALNLVNA